MITYLSTLRTPLSHLELNSKPSLCLGQKWLKTNLWLSWWSWDPQLYLLKEPQCRYWVHLATPLWKTLHRRPTLSAQTGRLLVREEDGTPTEYLTSLGHLLPDIDNNNLATVRQASWHGDCCFGRLGHHLSLADATPGNLVHKKLDRWTLLGPALCNQSCHTAGSLFVIKVPGGWVGGISDSLWLSCWAAAGTHWNQCATKVCRK